MAYTNNSDAFREPSRYFGSTLNSKSYREEQNFSPLEVRLSRVGENSEGIQNQFFSRSHQAGLQESIGYSNSVSTSLGSCDQAQVVLERNNAHKHSPQFEDFLRSFSIIASKRRTSSDKISIEGSLRPSSKFLSFNQQKCKLTHNKQPSSRISISPSLSSRRDGGVRGSCEISPSESKVLPRNLAASCHNPISVRKSFNTISPGDSKSVNLRCFMINSPSSSDCKVFSTEPDLISFSKPYGVNNCKESRMKPNKKRVQKVYSLNNLINKHKKEDLEKKVERNMRICQTEEDFDSDEISEGEEKKIHEEEEDEEVLLEKRCNSFKKHENDPSQNLTQDGYCEEENEEEFSDGDSIKLSTSTGLRYGRGGIGVKKSKKENDASLRSTQLTIESVIRKEIEGRKENFLERQKFMNINSDAGNKLPHEKGSRSATNRVLSPPKAPKEKPEQRGVPKLHNFKNKESEFDRLQKVQQENEEKCRIF